VVFTDISVLRQAKKQPSSVDPDLRLNRIKSSVKSNPD